MPHSKKQTCVIRVAPFSGIFFVPFVFPPYGRRVNLVVRKLSPAVTDAARNFLDSRPCSDMMGNQEAVRVARPLFAEG